MPGRLVLTHSIEVILESYKVERETESCDIPTHTNNSSVSPDSIIPRYNIAPSQNLLCVMGDENQRDVRFMKWGLIPFWAKDMSIGLKMINARSESIATKPSFRNSFKRKRCIIPVTGFYEWKSFGLGRKKQPYYFRKKNGGVISFAGLWESWTGDGKNHLYTCSIVTTEPNELIGQIHDRMGLILPGVAENIWLNPESKKDDLKELMIPYEDVDLEYYPVSQACNLPEKDSPDCIKRQKNLFD